MGGATISRAASNTRYKLNNRMLWFVAFVVLMTPFFLGGNRSVFWALWAVVVFGAGTVYFGVLAFAGASPRLTLGRFPLMAGLFFLMAVYMAIQVLPIAGYLPQSVVPMPEGLPRPATISWTPGETGLALMRWLTCGLLFYFSMQVAANKSRSRLLLRVLFWVVVTHAVYGLMLLYQFGDTILFMPKWSYQGSATGGFVNRNSYGTFLAIGSVLGLVVLVDSVLHRQGRLLAYIFDVRGLLIPICGWLVILVTLTATNSRMGFFAGFCGMTTAAVFLVLKERKRLSWRIVLGSFSTLVVLFVALFVLYGDTLAERVVGGIIREDARGELYQQTWRMIKYRPFTGFGGSSFELAFPVFRSPDFLNDNLWDKAHSTYLALWSDYGLIFGTIPMLIVIVALISLVARFYRSSELEPIVIAAIAAIITAAVHSLVDFSLEIQGVTFLFVVILAGAFARSVAPASGGEG